MENALTTYTDMSQMAKNIVKSGMFAMKTEEQALCLMAVCQAEGLHPMQAVRRYHIMNGGRPAMRADAMQAEFQRQGGTVKWIRRDDKACRAEFSHASGGTVVVEWTIEMAQKAGLTRNQTWTQYPRQMLTARVVSEGVRTVLPGVVAGIYTPEEFEDFGAKPDAPPSQKMPQVRSATGKTGGCTDAIPEEVVDPGSPATTQVVEAEFSDATLASPSPSLNEAPQGGADTCSDKDGANVSDSVHQAASASLPEGVPATAPTVFKELVALSKVLKQYMPADEHEALRADLNRAANDADRATIMQRVIDGLKGGF